MKARGAGRHLEMGDSEWSERHGWSWGSIAVGEQEEEGRPVRGRGEPRLRGELGGAQSRGLTWAAAAGRGVAAAGRWPRGGRGAGTASAERDRGQQVRPAFLQSPDEKETETEEERGQPGPAGAEPGPGPGTRGSRPPAHSPPQPAAHPTLSRSVRDELRGKNGLRLPARMSPVPWDRDGGRQTGVLLAACSVPRAWHFVPCVGAFAAQTGPQCSGNKKAAKRPVGVTRVSDELRSGASHEPAVALSTLINQLQTLNEVPLNRRSRRL